MEGREIENAFLSDPLCSRYYLSIYSADKIPEYIAPKKFLVYNETKSTDELGSHWCLISTTREQYLDVLSSIAIENFKTEFPRLVKCALNTKRKIFTFDKSLQSYQSTACGSYCIFFGYCISRLFSPNEIINTFFKKTYRSDVLRIWNDLKVCVIVKILFNLPRSTSLLLRDISFLLKTKNQELKRKNNQKNQIKKQPMINRL